MIGITGRSTLKHHFWLFTPGSLALLKHDDGTTLGTVRSWGIGNHEWLEGKGLFSTLLDAQKAVEKSAGGLK